MKNKTRHNLSFPRVFGLFSGLFLILLLSIILFNRYSNAPIIKRLVKNNTPYRQYINCSKNYVSIAEIGKKRYLGCEGGVIVLDQNDTIIDQLTMTTGLPDSSVTSLLSVDGLLYIGTHGGMSIYNPKNGTYKNFTSENGLGSGANIDLFLDYPSIWIANFKGVSRYNTKTKKIENFDKNLVPKGEVTEASDVLVLDKYVYFTYNANVNSRGGVSRFEKSTGNWLNYGPTFFGETGQYRRIDLTKIFESNGYVYVSNGADRVWRTINGDSIKWEKVSELPADVEQIVNEPYRDKDYDLNFINSTRPAKISSLYSVINGEIYLGSGGSVWKYNPNTKIFSKYIDSLFSDPITSTFESGFVAPIEGTDLMFIFGQACGMGCAFPNLGIYDFKTQELIEIIEKESDKEANEYSYDSYHFRGVSPQAETITLEGSISDLIVNIDEGSYEIVETESKSPGYKNYNCNLIYSHTNEDGFRRSAYHTSCNEFFEYKGKEYGWDPESNTLKITETLSGDFFEYVVPVSERSYSPFEDAYKYVLLDVAKVIDSTLWLGFSDNGITYGEPENNNWNLLSVGDGLISKQVGDFIVTEDFLVVLGRAGMSVLDR